MDGQSVYTRNYRRNVKEADKLTDEELADILKRHVGRIGTRRERDMIISEYLTMIVNMAARYANRGVHSDELIQEANLMLVLAVDELGESAPDHIVNNNNIKTAVDMFIRDRIRQCMIDMIDRENNDISEFGAAIAKAGLVYEAAKQLAEDNGRVASISELSEYTRISMDEIEDIIKFAGNTIETGDGKDLKGINDEIS